jgi:hypothetical protein
MKMISSRIDDFNEIKDCMARHAVYNDSDIIILEGDSLKLLQEMPSKKVSLLLTDPPYHSTKKDNILGDTVHPLLPCRHASPYSACRHPEPVPCRPGPLHLAC